MGNVCSIILPDLNVDVIQTCQHGIEATQIHPGPLLPLSLSRTHQSDIDGHELIVDVSQFAFEVKRDDIEV